MKKFVLLFYIILGGYSAFAQNVDRAKLDSLFSILETQNKFMGSFAMSYQGKTIYSRTVGYADADSKLKASDQAKYRIGSISKVFTATLIFMAAEEKKLRLTQTLNEYFPTVKNAAKITIENLLNHRSGIHDFTNDAAFPTWLTQKKSQVEMVKVISDSPSDFEPGTKAAYSNSNYVLLSFILEKAYKMPYQAILAAKITRPLKLQNTYLGNKIDVKKNEVNSYAYLGKWMKQPETDISIPIGAGGIVSNPSDLNRFLISLLQGQIINNKSLEQMTSIKDGYGMGIFRYAFADKKAFGHNGGIDGFASFAEYFADDKLALAITSNGNNYGNNEIVLAALNSFYGKPFKLPNFDGVTLKSEELDQYLGEYSSANFPLKIAVTKNGDVLMAQATGQSAFPLSATSKDQFEFATSGIVLIFNPSQKQMILKQGGGTYRFTKP